MHLLTVAAVSSSSFLQWLFLMVLCYDLQLLLLCCYGSFTWSWELSGETALAVNGGTEVLLQWPLKILFPNWL